jgi:dTDP-glucose pyrophosphorylase
MIDNSLHKFLVSADMIVRDAMKKLDESHQKILFVINDGQKLAGALTDGDIRRWILSGHDLEGSVAEVCNKNPVTVPTDYNLEEVKKLMLENRIQAIPSIGPDRELQTVLFWDAIFDDKYHVDVKESLSVPVVIMAGGAGTRLDPFTRILPKPLIPIGHRSILEVIIDMFREYGIKEYFISVYHKSKVIKAYLDELKPPYDIVYLEEDKPLGTVGALWQLKNRINQSLILTNCDTIIQCNYNDMIKFHEKNNYDITLVGSMINHKLPYGICEIEGDGKLVNLVEKPEYSYLVSTGMYALRNTALTLIPDNSFFNITDLIDKVHQNNGKVGVYPISEKSWLDTGEWQEYKKTVEQLS